MLVFEKIAMTIAPETMSDIPVDFSSTSLISSKKGRIHAIAFVVLSSIFLFLTENLVFFGSEISNHSAMGWGGALWTSQ